MKKIFLISFLILAFEHLNAQGYWTQKASLPAQGREGAIGFSIGNNGYIGTGTYQDSVATYWLKDFWEYNPNANNWTQKADLPIQIVNAVGFSIGNKGYIMTGNISQNVFEYDTTTNSWTQKSNFPGYGRSAAVGFSIGTKGYLGTGFGGTQGNLNDFWEYEPISDTWVQLANFPGSGNPGRVAAVGFSIGNKGYIGTGSDVSYFNDIWEYDTGINQWAQKNNFGGNGRFEAIAFSIGSIGYLGTGAALINPAARQDFWAYNSLTDTWVQKTNFGGIGRGHAVGFSINNKGYIGSGNAGNLQNDFWEFTPDTILGVPEKKEILNTVIVLPNPVIDISVIELTNPKINEFSEVRFYNIEGKIVRTEKLFGKHDIQINKNDFVSGLYFFSVNSNNKFISGKFIVD